MSDVGTVNMSNYRISDASEKSALDPRLYARNKRAEETDWLASMRQKVVLDIPDGGKGCGKGRGKGQGKVGNRCVRRVVQDAVHNISHPAFCRLAHRGGVQRMSGMIYEECRGVLRCFLEAVVKDVVPYALYCERKTVMPIDVVFALKRHGRNIYGFTSP